MDSYGDQVVALIDQLYGAALDDGLWPDALNGFRRLIDAEGATLFFTDSQLKPIDSFFGSRISTESVTSYLAHYYSVDIRMQRAIPDGVGKVVTDGDLVDEATVDNHEFYQDFLRPFGFRYVLGAIMDLGDGVFAFASGHRGLKQEHADRADVERATLLLPHLQRSLQLRRRFAGIRASEQAALEVLDQLGHGVFLISREGRVVWQNAAADQFLKQSDGLVTMDGELRTDAAKTTRELAALIRSAIERADKPKNRPGGLMTIARPSLRRAFQVLVSPLPEASSVLSAPLLSAGAPVAAVFITDPEVNTAPRAKVLAKLYHLTPAEARLATALASGVSVKAYADQEERSIHYVRWLLKQVEAKTDTRRIADLIRLLTSQTGFPSKISGDD